MTKFTHVKTRKKASSKQENDEINPDVEEKHIKELEMKDFTKMARMHVAEMKEKEETKNGKVIDLINEHCAMMS